MVYSNATSTERLQVHRALAEATDPRKDPQRRVWHEALAFNEPDEQLATRLESAASGCRSRGGIAEGAALIRRAADVSPDRQVRNRRLLEAAECYELAGAPIAALDALGEIDTPTLSGREQARLDRLRAHLAFSVERGRESAELLVASAERLQTLDPVLARETYLEALWGATISGRFADAGTITRVAKAVLRWQHESPKDSAALGDLLLSGMCFLLTDGYASGAAPLKAALQRFRELGVGESLEMSWSWVAIELWDDEAWHEITNAQVSRARATEAVMGLPLLLNFLAGFLIFAGELQSGSLLIEEGDYVADVIGQPRPLYVALSLAAVRGDEDEVNRLSNAARKEGEQRGEGLSISTAEYYSAMLNNSLSRYEEAFALALSVVSRETLGISSWALFELVEASSRIGRQDEGLRALDILAEQASAADTNWVNGTYLGARALLSQPIDADRLFLEALTLLAKSRMRLQHARTDLLYGEWLRRQRRRSEARIHLRSAYDSFEAMGALAFAARAQRELAAAGSYVSLSMSQEQTILTPQETQVARLAAEGLSNGEIASRLFLSRRTIEYHLNKVYQKLGISSRRGLMRSIFVG
jgi:DNA-binding NarL/FixJ family response regulator